MRERIEREWQVNLDAQTNPTPDVYETRLDHQSSEFIFLAATLSVQSRTNKTANTG